MGANELATVLLGVLVASSGGALPGCAFAEVKVKLDPSATVASTEGMQREVVVFPSVDQRENARNCGARRNAHGADVGRVRCLMDPSQWLNETVLNGLHRRNFKIVQLDNAKSASPIQVSLALKTLFIDEVFDTSETVSMLADVEVHVVARTSSGLLAERSFFVRERQAMPTESSYQDTLTLATRQMSSDIIDAIVELAHRYPWLGRAEPPAAVSSL